MIRMAAAPLTAASPEKNGIEHAAEPDGRLRMPSQSATLPPFFLTLLGIRETMRVVLITLPSNPAS